MTREEYIDLFHRAQVNLVAFKPVFHCDAELQRMVEMAVEAEREASAKVCEQFQKDYVYTADLAGTVAAIKQRMADAIRARGEK